MPSTSIVISIRLNVGYFERKTKFKDDEINKLVYDYVEEERNALATEARIATIHLLNGEPIDGS